MRKMSLVRALAAITATTALVGALAPRASAATATANLTVSATVTNNCTVSTSALAFGSYDPVVGNASANLDGTGTVSVRQYVNQQPQYALFTQAALALWVLAALLQLSVPFFQRFP